MALQVELVPTGEIIRVVHPHRPCKLALGSDGVRVTMESALTARDRVGVQDFVLLENFTSEAAFIENLRRRFRENLIYTYIGPVLVSVNPYRDLQIYSRQHMERYRGVSFYEVPPHLFAVADTVYRALRTERRDQAVMISGESGAGKTEATKRLLQFYAETCPAPERGGAVRDRLLQSNPVLEAFGNAKTLRNDNSSRFGKYMDVQFDFKGAPVGGHILSYLLEKSRVVHQNHGERNFHVFYQLLEGGEEETLRRLGLERNPQSYLYLVKGQCAKVSSINDKSDWKVVRKALTVIDFTEDEVEDLLSIVASVLHLGNIHFAADEESNAQVTTENQLKYLTRLLSVEGSTLREALTHRKIIAKGEELLSPLNLEQAAYARDALAKAVYSRTFTWLVGKINRSLASKDAESPNWRSTTVLGLLDIYGFEVFQHNSFEQFCINYCNEKLQQLFIELTLKSEQEEYEAEGIAWEPVQYFNNKIICDLVEEKFKGIISILDEECLRPGEATDLTFLEKLEDTVKHHPHFLTCRFDEVLIRHQPPRPQPCLAPDPRLIRGFILRHAPRCPENAFFFFFFCTSFLLNLRRQLPRNVFFFFLPTPPPALREASELLRELCIKNMVWKYCRSISPEWKQQLQQKAVASEIFKGKKDNYPQSVPRLFISTRLGADEISSRVLQALGSEPIQYAVPVVKYDRKGYKPRSRQLLLTPNAVVIVEDAKVKQRIDYANLTGISVSSLSDSLFVLHVQREDNKQKGDVVLQSDHVIETLTKTAISADRVNNVNINQGSITFAGGPGRDGTIDFTPGSELLITKAKNGHLAVVAPRLNSR
ncbi:PREDICTED: unconventional myosin-Ic [Cercocebus atys]|uniref:unconventional myosin-Ic n=1 Tax=Cercocebus atys TaxID=9531 RepID=UPI0005F52B4E|nr:PREDICTED: unconventional myosin-Ic [Cercocebus atys]